MLEERGHGQSVVDFRYYTHPCIHGGGGGRGGKPGMLILDYATEVHSTVLEFSRAKGLNSK